LDFPLLSVGLSAGLRRTFQHCPVISGGFACWFVDILAGLSAGKVRRTNQSGEHAPESHWTIPAVPEPKIQHSG